MSPTSRTVTARRKSPAKPARVSTGHGGKRRSGGAGGGRGWIRPAIVILAAVEALLLGGHAVRWARSTTHFRLDRMVVAGHASLRPAEIVEMAGLRPGANIFDADLETARARVAAHPWIKRVSVRRRLPHFVDVEIVERRPAALLAGAETMVVDAEGVILGRLKAPSAAKCLPLIEGLDTKDIRPGGVVRDVRFTGAMEGVSLLRNLPVFRGGCGISVRGAGANQFRFRALGGKVEVMVSEEGMMEQTERLRAIAGDILRKGRLKGRNLRLDLRFPGRVIVRPLSSTKGREKG